MLTVHRLNVYSLYTLVSHLPDICGEQTSQCKPEQRFILNEGPKHFAIMNFALLHRLAIIPH